MVSKKRTLSVSQTQYLHLTSRPLKCLLINKTPVRWQCSSSSSPDVPEVSVHIVIRPNRQFFVFWFITSGSHKGKTLQDSRNMSRLRLLLFDIVGCLIWKSYAVTNTRELPASTLFRLTSVIEILYLTSSRFRLSCRSWQLMRMRCLYGTRTR